MKKIGKILSISAAVLFLNSTTLQAGMVEQVLYNVVGQVSNAIGARLGDEVYYGSSRGQRVVRHRVKHRKHRKHRKKVVKKRKIVSPKVVITDEKRIQKALKSLGFYQGAIDGEVNSFETRNAIKKLNQTYGIAQDAFLSPKVKDNLIFLGTLFDLDRKIITKGKDKKSKAIKLQTALKINGFYSSKIDGVAGKGTREAIEKYKKANNLSAGSKLNFEEEYRLISSAKEANDKNIESTIASIKAIGLNNKGVVTNQVAQSTPINQNRMQTMQQNSAQSVQQTIQVNSAQTNNNANTQQTQQRAIQTIQQVKEVQTPNNNNVQEQVAPSNVQTPTKEKSNFAYKMLTKIKKESVTTATEKPEVSTSAVAKTVSVQKKNSVATQQSTTTQNNSNIQPAIAKQNINQNSQSTSLQNSNGDITKQVVSAQTSSVVTQTATSQNNSNPQQVKQNTKTTTQPVAIQKNEEKKDVNKTISLKVDEKNSKVAQLIEEISK